MEIPAPARPARILRSRGTPPAQAEHVKSRKDGHQPAESEQSIVLATEGLAEDCILAEEAAAGPDPGERQRADDEGPEGHGHSFAQRAHFPNVLLVMERDDYGTRAQEQKRLEKSMSGQVK